MPRLDAIAASEPEQRYHLVGYGSFHRLEDLIEGRVYGVAIYHPAKDKTPALFELLHAGMTIEEAQKHVNDCNHLVSEGVAAVPDKWAVETRES